MKIQKFAVLTLGALALTALAGCGQQPSDPYNWASGDTVYTEMVLFDKNDTETKNVHFLLNKEGNIKSVKLGRDAINYGYHGGVLTLSAASLKNAPSGEKDLVVAMDKGGSVTVPLFNADKFIKTPEDFQKISDNLDGYYVLANDIDFKDFGTFEPLGRMADEADPDNHYFHGVLEGNGYSLKNMNISYSDGPIATSGSGYPSNYDVYTGNGKFKVDSHVMGDNIGIFQCIGSSGVVRNVTFDNVDVHGRTIVGVIAGNLAGTVQNCLITSTCSVLMDTHFWDDDCNCGGAFGIVAGTGKAENVISLTSSIQVRNTYEDYGDQYIGESGTGYDHGYNTQNPFWRFWGNDKPDSPTDSNGSPTNGTYAFVGKCWGQVKNSIGKAFKFTPNDGTERAVFFGQTHLGANKPTSGESNMGELENCKVLDDTGLKASSNYTTFGAAWNIADGSFPSLNAGKVVPSQIAK